jgi:hypothetical protein
MSFYVRRIFNDGITSCGGPWQTEDQARYMASHVGPANSLGVSVITERDDPAPTGERPLLLATEHRGIPDLRVVIGPFQDRQHIAQFIAQALGTNFRAIPMADVSDWQLVELDGEQSAPWPG